MCTHAVILEKKIPRTKNYGSADKQNFSWCLHIRLAVSGKAYPLPSHVMGGGGGERKEREEEQEKKKVFTYLI